MTGIVRVGQILPEAFADTLRQLRATDSDQLNAVLALAHANGWTYQALADPLGVSRQAVEQRIRKAHVPAGDIDIPPPPRRPTPMPAVRRRLTLRAEVVEELRRMWAVAATVNGGTAVDDPARRVSEAFTAQVAGYVAQGVTVYWLAQQLGMTEAGLSFRLGRHGYRDLPPSMAKQPEPRLPQPEDRSAGVIGREHCEPLYDEAGELVAVARVSEDITDEGRAALRRLVEAAKRRSEADLAADPTIGERQEAARRRIAERNRRLRGESG